MAVNKVVLGDSTLIDLTYDTASEEDVIQGKYFHRADGERVEGTRDPNTGGGDTSVTDLLNIHYGEDEPASRSELWVNTSAHERVAFSPKSKLPEDICAITTLPEKFEKPAAYICCAAVGTKIYLFGGSIGGRTDKIQCFDTATETLSTLPEKLHIATNLMCCAAVGTKIYLFGGYGQGVGALDTISCFDTETQKIDLLETKLPAAIYYSTCAAVNGKIYLFGGYDGSTYYDTVICFDTVEKTISTLGAKLTRPAYGVACAAVGTKIWAMGGYATGGYINTLIFDTETQAISATNGIAYTVCVAACAAIGTCVYTFGGLAGKSEDKIQYKDTVSGEYGILSVKLAIGAYAICCATVGRYIYVFGGYDQDTKTSNDLIQRFTAQTHELSEGELSIYTQDEGNMFSLIKTNDFSLETGVHQVYIGDRFNFADRVDAYLYNETTSAWELI